MASIVFYASLAEDSVGIRRWLEASAVRLHKKGFMAVEMASGGRTGSFSPVEPLAARRHSTIWGPRLNIEGGNSPAAQQEHADLFVEGLERAADAYGDVVVVDDVFFPLAEPEGFLLPAMRLLSTQHDLRVAFYAPPQHKGLEGLWRTEGIDTEMQPAAFLAHRTGSLRYVSTFRRIKAELPNVELAPIPAYRNRPDSLDPLADFATRFFDVEADHREWVYGPPPLEVINLFRAAQCDQRSREELTADRMERVVRLAAGCVWPEDDQIATSRMILHRYAFDAFAEENAELGWPDLVPPPDARHDTPELEALDELWNSPASAIERTVLLRALDTAI